MNKHPKGCFLLYERLIIGKNLDMDRLFISNIEDNEIFYSQELKGMAIENVLLMKELAGVDKLKDYWQGVGNDR